MVDYEIADELADNDGVLNSARVWFHLIRNAERAMKGLPLHDSPVFFITEMENFYDHYLKYTSYETHPVTCRNFVLDEELFLAMSDVFRRRLEFGVTFPSNIKEDKGE